MPANKLWVGNRKQSLLAAGLIVGIDRNKGLAKIDFRRGDWEKSEGSSSHGDLLK